MSSEWTLGELKEKLLARREIDKKTKCWVYTGQWDVQGYGRIEQYRGRDRGSHSIFVHRIAAAVWLGLPLNGEHIVLHNNKLCDCRACFNPKHLVIAANLSEASSLYMKKPRGVNHRRASIDDEKAELIIDLILDGTRVIDICKFCEVNRMVVNAMKAKRTWKHVWETVLARRKIVKCATLM